MTKVAFYKTTVGKKFLMGIAGAVWAGFVLAHMLGNLLIFIGPEAYNLYGHKLTSGGIIYVAEAVLIIAFLVHVILAIQLTAMNKKARGAGYNQGTNGEKGVSLASRTMAAQGLIVLFFLAYHLITFKFGPYFETVVDGVIVRDLYQLLVLKFSQPLYVVGYIVCLIILGLHLSHGVGSIFQSLGLGHKAYTKKYKILSYTYAAVVVLGFISQPVYIFLVAN